MNKKYFFSGFVSGGLLSVVALAVYLFVLIRQPDVALNQLQLQDLEEQPVAVTSLSGKPTVVNFWATWCKPCIAEMPAFLQAHDSLGDELNIVFVSEESRDKVNHFLEKKGYNGLYYLSKLPLDSLGIQALPTTYFYDRQGRLQEKQLGGLEFPELMNKLKALKNQ